MFALAPLTPKSLDELLAKLPASERAAIAWAPQAVALQLERYFSAPALTPDLVSDVSTAVMSRLLSLRGLLKSISAASKDDLLARMRSITESQTSILATELPVASRRAAIRANLTWLMLAGAASVTASGVGMDLAQFSGVLQRESPEVLEQLLASAKGFPVAMAILHAIETGRSREGRTQELVALADLEAKQFATALAALYPAEPRARLPWYFEDGPDAELFRAIAIWAAAQNDRNDRALALLDRWLTEPEDPAEREQWERVRRELDRDRLSSRPLFS